MAVFQKTEKKVLTPPTPPTPSSAPLPTPLPTPVGTPTPVGAAPAPAPVPGRYQDKIFPKNDLVVTQEVRYRKVSDQYGSFTLHMDIYQPPLADTIKNRPVIVWIHGGNFTSGNREQMQLHAEEFAQRGYVAASIDYRKLRSISKSYSPQVAASAAQADAQVALDYLKQNAQKFRIDPSLAFVGGFSSGSITAGYVGYKYEDLGLSASPVKGVVLLDGYLITAADFRTGDPPFILVQSGTATGGRDADLSLLPALLAGADSVGIIYDAVQIPKTSHSDLFNTTFVPQIAGEAAKFLYEEVLK